LTAVATFHFAAQASRVKYLIAPSAAVTATGDSTIGIDGSTWSVVGTYNSVVGDWVVSAATKDSCVVTAPSGSNKSCLLKRLVTTTVGGRSTQIQSTAKIYSGVETICPNETDESDQVNGWGDIINDLQTGGVVLPDAVFTSSLDMLSNGKSVYAGENGGAFLLGLASTSGFLPGSQVQVTIPANTATTVTLAANIDPTGDIAAQFVATEDFVIFVTATASTRVVVSAQSRPALVTTTPTIVSAEVEAADLDKLIVTFSASMQCPVSPTYTTGDVTGLSLTGTMSTPRTLSSVASGNGTTAITFDLSGDLALSDTPNFAIATARTLSSLNGTKPAVGSTAITIDPGIYDYASATGLTAFMDPALGNGSLADGAACASWTSQAGTAAPVFTAAGAERTTFRASKGGMPALEWDGSANVMQTTDTVDDLWNNTTAMWLGAVWIDAIDVTANQATVYLNVGLVSDAVGYVGCFVKTNPEVRGYAFDGSVEQSPASAITAGAWHVVGFRIEGGNLYSMVDGTWSAAEPLDAGITTLTDVVRIGRGPGAGLYFDGWMGKNLFFDAIPGDLTAIVDSLKSEYGVA
jgi:hypothetical protein